MDDTARQTGDKAKRFLSQLCVEIIDGSDDGPADHNWGQACGRLNLLMPPPSHFFIRFGGGLFTLLARVGQISGWAKPPSYQCTPVSITLVRL